MSWSDESRARELLSRERALFTAARGGRTGICLAYPNRYSLGMGNLGFQTVYRILSTAPGHYCERAFLPEGGTRLVTLESRRPAGELDVFALSISFETDYLNVPTMLEGAGLPLSADERDERHPLVIAGGSAVFLNPEPIAEFVDVFLIGEAEEMLPEFLAFLENARERGRSRDELLEE
ncbi:MAG TPA: radical SAM protein, partial [Candidatus Binatia bacterium]|nr:radical SAM protein [Candidatus Binatia bacterium]